MLKKSYSDALRDIELLQRKTDKQQIAYDVYVKLSHEHELKRQEQSSDFYDSMTLKLDLQRQDYEKQQLVYEADIRKSRAREAELQRTLSLANREISLAAMQNSILEKQLIAAESEAARRCTSLRKLSYQLHQITF